jgi:hypothetical protein
VRDRSVLGGWRWALEIYILGVLFLDGVLTRRGSEQTLKRVIDVVDLCKVLIWAERRGGIRQDEE